MATHTTRHRPEHTTTATVSLTAARLEEDDAIRLLVTNPTKPRQTLTLRLPDPAHCPRGTQDQRTRLHAARQSLIDTIGMPPFEGFAMLYGTARLTLLTGGAADEDGGVPVVLDFQPQDSPPPAGCAPLATTPRYHRSAAGHASAAA